MYPSFMERRKALEEIQPASWPHFIWASDLANEPDVPTSLERLAALPTASWDPEQFEEAVTALIRDAGLTACVLNRNDPLPDKTHTRFSFSPYNQIEDVWAGGRDGVAVAVIEEHRLIGYGIATRSKEGTEIEIIEVDTWSRRYAGLQALITVGGESFGVGVGHILAAELKRVLGRPTQVDATSDESQYIFRSVGFERSADDNPCLYVLPSL